MSNVLIGIIGVILFIGLALAGALILGDDFTSARIDSRATLVVTRLQQMQSAIEMHRLKTGSPLMVQAGLQSLVPRFLKVVPDNPTRGTPPYLSNETGDGTGTAMYVTFPLIDQAEAICRAIVVQTGMAPDGVIPRGEVTGPQHPIGCTYNGGTSYTAYAKFR